MLDSRFGYFNAALARGIEAPDFVGDSAAQAAPFDRAVPPVDTFDDFTGTPGDDTFTGTNGNDTFDLSSGGNDTVHGRGGDDVVVFTGGGFSARDQIDGGSDTYYNFLDPGDEVLFNSPSGESDYSAGVTFGPKTIQNVETLTLGPGQFNFVLNDGNVSAQKILEIYAEGTSDQNTADSFYHIDGSAESDGDFKMFDLGAADDTFIGGGGNDLFRPGTGGTDIMDGGGGWNEISFSGPNNHHGVTVSLALHGVAQNVGGGHIVTLSHFYELQGTTFADTLTGDAYANYINGNGGDDTIHAAAGDDWVLVYAVAGDSGAPLLGSYHVTVDGGNGHDTLSLWFLADPGQPDVGEGVDFSLALEGGLQTVGTDKTVIATNFEDASGTPFDDSIAGDQDGNALYGDAGNDNLSGAGGNDSLFGDKYFTRFADSAGNGSGVGVADATSGGDDVLAGGGGDDTLDGGDGDDTMNGGAGADAMNGGTGSDSFVYDGVHQSTSRGFDTIAAFDAAGDLFDLPFSVTAIDPKFKAGTLSDATFDGDLAHAVNAARLGAHHAVLFTARHGDYAGETFLVIDANGTAGYQAGEDLVVRLDAAMHLADLATGNFI